MSLSSRPSPLRPLLLAVAVVMVALVLPATAGADSRSDRREVQRQRAAVAAELDTLRATDAQVEAALRVLQENVRLQTAALRDAERKVAEAEALLADATARVDAKESEIAMLDQAVEDFVIEAYIRPPSSGGLLDSLGSANIGEAELKQALLEAKSSSQLDLLDQLERAREDLELARSQAAEASAAAESHRSQVDARLSDVAQARDQQAAVVAEVDARLEHKLSEAANLADLDRRLADEIAAEQARIAARLASGRGSGGGGPVSITGSGSIVSVRGIRVHESIADEVKALLEAADADGIHLSGGGYRDPNQQIALRRAHCGTSNYDVYQKPPSQCRPPTARPGESMHERGLAIDFTHNGSAIRSRSSAAYQWLKGNAARYGFYNLPSEPWHWSVNGD